MAWEVVELVLPMDWKVGRVGPRGSLEIGYCTYRNEKTSPRHWIRGRGYGRVSD